MQKCTDFPEASHYSVELGREGESVHQTEHQLIVMLCLSSFVFSHSPQFQFSPVLVTQLCSFIVQNNQHRIGFDSSLFFKNYFSSPQIIQEPSVHRISGVTSSRGDLSPTKKPKTNQTEQAGSAK